MCSKRLGRSGYGAHALRLRRTKSLARAHVRGPAHSLQRGHREIAAPTSFLRRDRRPSTHSVRLPVPSPNPRYGEFRAILAAHPGWMAPWSGHFFRFQTIKFPTARDILSGLGAKQRGGRWNPPGLPALYGNTTDSAALEEAKANDRYYGLETKTPRLVVAICAELERMLDLTLPAARRQLGITLPELAGEDWRKLLQSGQESLGQSLGRAAASVGASGIIVRSAVVRRAHNVVVFPQPGFSGRLSVIEGDALDGLAGGKTA